MFIYNYERRNASSVKVGDQYIGGNHPILIQSMANTSTLDTIGSANQAKAIVDAGGKLVRFTTQGVKEAANLEKIRVEMERLGCNVPISADVHFNPKAAFVAAHTADKVRINPGNFVDAARTFRKIEFSDEEYAREINRIRETLIPFLKLCAECNTAVRLGVNHGSLSDRIMSRYGDSAPGMVESVMEFLRIAAEIDFKDIVISIKASNTVVMVQAVRLLAEQMRREGMNFPLHLGVTEAGDAEDGRIKSAVGIGALLHEGLGDTIRVSLSEPPEDEIPVAQLLCDHVARRKNVRVIEPGTVLPGPARDYAHDAIAKSPAAKLFPMAATKELARFNEYPNLRADGSKDIVRIVSANSEELGRVASDIDVMVASGCADPVIVELKYNCDSLDELRVRAGADFGALLLSGYASGIKVTDPGFSEDELYQLELDILQAARMRISKTEYISCPSCGRTLFDLPAALYDVKQAVDALDIKGLKIAVMGCVVNGPGEMADADYGYVGAGPGRVSLYKGKELVVKNIPASEALPALLRLIAGHQS
ncbi:MAG: (E)-4-hydroxy-3-methylbut-2-enyl-diphosphate synthase [Candidatus Amulumruptor caecigallinarius]|nr:(E)-4-hydroxy-3-methylbut-2-enyl-diphosphate synthase [Candidatus Amulumruptor caecigallinarius]